MVSLKDIAAELNVSVSLVSKVLNGRLGTTGVRPELGGVIRRKAREMGYERNASAVALSRGRQDVLGVFIHRLGMAGSGIIEDLVDGISEAAREAHQKQFVNFFSTVAEFAELSRVAHRGMMDGLIVGGVRHEELVPHIQEISRSGLPVVTLYNTVLHESLPNVGMDQREVGGVATRHLLMSGCRRIAHICNIQERFEGYKAALAEQGVPFRPELVWEAPSSEFSHTLGAQAVRQLSEAGIAFDGLVAQSDQEAVGGINELFRMGRRVPEDVRVIGIDNAPHCEFARVPLSSVSQRFGERGREAVRMLLKQIEGRHVPSLELTPILCPRRSSE